MGIVRRLTTTVSSHFNWVINQIENHEALVDAAIQDAQAAVAKAKAQLGRVTRDGDRLEQRLDETKRNYLLWQERAIKFAASEQEKALECLKRKKNTLALQQQLEEERRRHRALEMQLAADITNLQQKVRTLRDQRNVMRTRESRANAAKILGEHQDVALIEIDNIFERWEAKISEYESSEDLLSDTDALEHACVTQEEREALQKELSALLETSNAGTKAQE